MKYGICHLSIVPIREENSHKSELVSQLLYGDCFKINSEKKDWLQITTLHDNYSGWIDKKQMRIISQNEAENISGPNAKYCTQLVDYIEAEDHSLTTVVMGSNVAAATLLNQTFKGKQ